VKHLTSFCDEVRVLDDGSDDGTFEWLQEQRGVHVARNPGPAFFEFESKARQNLLEWTMEARPDYVLSIDADEFVGDPEVIRRCVNEGKPVYTLWMQEVWSLSDERINIRMDGQWGRRLCPILWRAPASLSREWSIPERKLACGREPLQVRRTRFVKSGTDVFHLGWANESERAARYERYAVHDQGKFHRDAHLQSIMWPAEKVILSSARWPVGMSVHREQLLERACRVAS
jgi:glycosyltransferase involved in cell wall biosynthesis